MEKDITGKKFGHLTVMSYKMNTEQHKSYICQCDCGNTIVIGRARLLGVPGRSPERSCGCHYKKRNGYTVKYKRLASIWNGMIARCGNPAADNYERYGKDNVKVCKKWRDSLVVFVDWALENGYSEKLTLDRIDNEKGYSPKNCRWVSCFTQAQNQRVSKRSTTGYKGVYVRGKGFSAEIMRDGVHKYLGFFKDKNDAILARKQADDHYEKYGTI